MTDPIKNAALDEIYRAGIAALQRNDATALGRLSESDVIHAQCEPHARAREVLLEQI